MSGASRRRKAKARAAAAAAWSSLLTERGGTYASTPRGSDWRAATPAAAEEMLQRMRAVSEQLRLKGGPVLRAEFVIDPTRCTKGAPRALSTPALFGHRLVQVFCFDEVDRQVAMDQLSEASGAAEVVQP